MLVVYDIPFFPSSARNTKSSGERQCWVFHLAVAEAVFLMIHRNTKELSWISLLQNQFLCSEGQQMH